MARDNALTEKEKEAAKEYSYGRVLGSSSSRPKDGDHVEMVVGANLGETVPWNDNASFQTEVRNTIDKLTDEEKATLLKSAHARHPNWIETEDLFRVTASRSKRSSVF